MATTINNQGQSTSKNDLEELFQVVQDQRTVQVDTVRDVTLAVRLLSAVEARRLAQKAGADDPRVAALASRDASLVDRVSALEVERQVSTIRVAPVAKTETLLNGRVTDEQAVAAGPLTVTLVDQQGQPLPNVAPVETDSAGYYAIVLTQEQVQAFPKGGVSVQLQRGDTKLVPSDATGISLTPGTVAVKEVRLTPSQLDQLVLKPSTSTTIPSTRTTTTTTTTTSAPKAETKAAAQAAAPHAAHKAEHKIEHQTEHQTEHKAGPKARPKTSKPPHKKK